MSAITQKIRLVCTPCTNFGRYLVHMIRLFFCAANNNNNNNNNNADDGTDAETTIVLHLGLYIVYPLLLWLLLTKFHGLCGHETHAQKVEAIDACLGIYLYFTTLLRTFKLGIIVRYNLDAAEKQDEKDDTATTTTTASTSSSTCKKHTNVWTRRVQSLCKCQAWMQLSHELGLVGAVAFLIVICLPVLAFWVMFLSILRSCYNLIQLLRRFWNEAQNPQQNRNNKDTADDDEAGLLLQENGKNEDSNGQSKTEAQKSKTKRKKRQDLTF